MNVFKTILGVIVIILGLGMAAAGLAIAVYGQFTPLTNVFLGFSLGFMGIGLCWPGLILIRGSSVRDALGGVTNALQGHGGVGLHKGDTYYIPPGNIKEILLDVLKYTIIAIVVILIAIFSIFRAIGGFPIHK